MSSIRFKAQQIFDTQYWKLQNDFLAFQKPLEPLQQIYIFLYSYHLKTYFPARIHALLWNDWI